MKELYTYPKIKSFKDESCIEESIRVGRGDALTDNLNVEDTVNGESVVDIANLRELKNINGKIYKQAIVDGEIKYKLLE